MNMKIYQRNQIVQFTSQGTCNQDKRNFQQVRKVEKKKQENRIGISDAFTGIPVNTSGNGINLSNICFTLRQQNGIAET